MEHLKLESATDSPEFWNDSYAISSYCNSLLQATGKIDDVVSIFVQDYDAQPRVSYRKDRDNNQNKFSIYLPKIKDFYIDESIQEDDIKLRKAFLKHEVAHIIYSDMESYTDHHRGDPSDVMFLNNAIEDVRIEWAFGKRFPGANDTFFDVQKKFFNRGKEKIEIDSPTFQNLAFYFIYRSKRFEFKQTFSTEIYDKIFSKYSDFLNLSRQEVAELVRQIKKDFNQELQERKDDIKAYEEMLDEEYEEVEYEEGDYTQEDSEEDSNQSQSSSYNPKASMKSEKEKPQPSIPDLSPKEKNEKQEEDSESDSEEDESENSSSQSSSNGSNENREGEYEDTSESGLDDEESEEEEEEFDEDEDLDDEELDESSDLDEEVDDREFNNKDFSSMLADEMKNNLEDELDNIKEQFGGGEKDKSNSEKFNSTVDSLSEKLTKEDGSEINIIDVLKLIKGCETDLIEDILNHESQANEFIKYNNSKMRNLGSKVVDASRYLSIANKKKKRKKNDPNVRSLYNKIVAANNQNIIKLSNYFRLKFQDKEKSKRFFNKEQGDLNNEALYKILNKKQFDSRIFSMLEKTLVTKDDVSFLLDFSGSMSGYKLRNLLESVVVLNEVFSKINIPFNVFSFSGKDYHHISYKFNSLSEKIALQKMYPKHMYDHKVYDSEISFRLNEQFSYTKNNFTLIYCLINRNTRGQERKKIIELLLNCSNNGRYFGAWDNFFSGSTPECPAVIGLYNALPKQKLFLINDGEYDSFSFQDKEMKLINNSNISDSTKFVSFYNFAYDFIFGKEVIISNSEQERILKDITRTAYSLFTKNFRYSNYYKFFEHSDYDKNKENLVELDKAQQVFSDLDNFLYDFNFSDKENIETKFFKLDRKYFQKKDVTHNKIIMKDMPSFKIKVNKKLLHVKETCSTDRDVSFYLDRDEITSIEDMCKLFFLMSFSQFFDTAYNTSKSEYTYKDLFNKMRSSGWEIYGIGIENNNGEKYIGKENFTLVKNSSDIRNNLEKKIKKII
jgi:hypothetical protein